MKRESETCGALSVTVDASITVPHVILHERLIVVSKCFTMAGTMNRLRPNAKCGTFCTAEKTNERGKHSADWTPMGGKAVQSRTPAVARSCSSHPPMRVIRGPTSLRLRFRLVLPSRFPQLFCGYVAPCRMANPIEAHILLTHPTVRENQEQYGHAARTKKKSFSPTRAGWIRLSFFPGLRSDIPA